MSRKKILSDHTQKGKVFQPPLLTIGTFVETAWLDYAVPEFIWIMLLVKEYGVDYGSRIAIDFAMTADKYIIKNVESGPASPMIISFYNLLSENDKTELFGKLRGKGLTIFLQKAFKSLLLLYPKCPLGFLKGDLEDEDIDAYIPYFKQSISDLLDKTEYKPTIVMANVINFMLTMNRFFVAESNDLPGLNEVLDYPNTDSSKRIAAFLRSSISMCFAIGSYDRENNWAKYFWNRSIEIEPCTI